MATVLSGPDGSALFETLPDRFILHQDKVPVSINGYQVNPHDPKYHMSYAVAVERAAATGYGIGFSVPDNMVIYDYDHIIDLDNQRIAQWAEESFRYIPQTYQEYSPSETGIHAWFFAADEETQEYIHQLKKLTVINAAKDQKFEYIRQGFYITITGKAVPLRPLTIATINKPMLAKFDRFIQGRAEKLQETPKDETPVGPASDAELEHLRQQIIQGITFNLPMFTLAWNFTLNNRPADDAIVELESIFDLSERQDDNWERNRKKIPNTVERCVKYHKQNANAQTEIGRAKLACSERQASKIFAERTDKILAYTPQLGWLMYDNDRFAPIIDARLFMTISATLVEYYTELLEEMQSGAGQKIVTKFINKLHNLALLRNIAIFAESDLLGDINNFDNDPYILNTPSGIINFQDQIIYTHSPHFLQTQLTPATYQPNATTPVFDRFILDICLDREGLAEDMLNMMAYGLTGMTQENLFFVLYGQGGNGKSTLINIFKHLLYAPDDLGCYFDTWSAETLEQKSNQAVVDYSLAKARRARVVICPEIGNNKLSNTRIKLLTGNDAVNARVIYKSPFTFVPQFKVLFVTNHMPKVDPDDYAMARRARLFPFNTKFVEDPQLPHERKRDRLIEDKLKEERDGILTKLVNRAFELVSIGRLPEPSHETKLATAQWFMDIDPVMNFINECVERTDQGCIGTSHLWEAFKQFCMMNNERYTGTQRKFTNNMQEKLGQSFQRGTYMKVQQNVFYGIKLRESPDNRKDF